jgi:cytochrome c peroxidase
MEAMSRRLILGSLAFCTLLIAGDTAWARALVGETRSATIDQAPLVTPEALKTEYRRPATIPFPSRNPYTPAKAILGRMLFYDTRLSGGGALACASCHNPAFAHGDGHAKSIGEGMRTLDRRSPTVIDSAWGQLFMWDGRAASLEQQALLPIQAPAEMNEPLDRMIEAVSQVGEYKTMIATVFPRRGLTPATVAEAIATYERTIVSAPAPFDAWIEGDASAISDAASRGFVLFNTKAGCASCHGGWRFTDDGFHDTGLPDGDAGRGLLFPHVIKMGNAFKTPGLREVGLRGPYMHDGSLPTLEAVVAHYNQGGVNRGSQSELVKPLGLSAGEQADIVAFLQTLNGSVTSNLVPALPR